jgi:DNA-binding Lrp family transcriptional regulator
METGSLIIIEPENRFKKICRHIIENYEPVVVGAYCKIVTLGTRTKLNIKYLSKMLGLSPAKMRSIIVLLEDDGYIRRVPAKDENGKLKGWIYYVYPQQVAEKDRSCAGRNAVLSENRQHGEPTTRETDKTGNRKDIYKDYKGNNKDLDKEKEKTPIDIGVKNGAEAPAQSDDEKYFYDFLKERCPFVYKMQVPLTYEQYKKACTKYSREKIWQTLDEMNNWKELNKKRRYAYKTLITWLDKDVRKYA